MAAAISVTLAPVICPDDECQSQHPNIQEHRATLRLTTSAAPIGHVKVYTFHTSSMRTLSPNRMWEESQAFDEKHIGAKLDKIDNFLANESFPVELEVRISGAEAILFVDQVWLELKHRGHGLGLEAVRETVRLLGLPEKTVAMLQAGSMGGSVTDDAMKAGEKLARHWGKLGFEPWSESDDSWLLLWLHDSDMKSRRDIFPETQATFLFVDRSDVSSRTDYDSCIFPRSIELSRTLKSICLLRCCGSAVLQYFSRVVQAIGDVNILSYAVASQEEPRIVSLSTARVCQSLESKISIDSPESSMLRRYLTSVRSQGTKPTWLASSEAIGLHAARTGASAPPFAPRYLTF